MRDLSPHVPVAEFSNSFFFFRFRLRKNKQFYMLNCVTTDNYVVNGTSGYKI